MKRNTIAIVIAVIAILVIGGIVMAARNNKKTETPTPAPTTSTTPSNNNATNTSGGSDTANTSPSTTPTEQKTNITIQNFAFSPASTSVKKGTTVIWTNKDSAPHTVTIDSGEGPKSGNLNTGDTYSYTFTTSGTFAYHCAIHPNMTATVTVTD